MSYDVIVKIIADGAKAKAEFDRAGKAAERMAKKTEDEVQKARISMEKFGRQAGIAGAAMIGAAGTVAFAMKSWVNSAQEAEMATMRLESSVKGAYGVSSNAVKAFEAQAKAIQKVTVAADEDVMSIQALLVQFGLTQRQVTQLTPLVVDISRKWGIDYVTAAKAVAKAADGKATALKKLGINIDETKAKTDPYLATVDALRRAAGGFAEQEGRTFAGQTAILANQMDELKESLGRGVLSVLNDVLPAVNKVSGAFTGLDDATGGLVGRTAAIGTGLTAVAGGALLVTSAVIKLRTAYAEATAASVAFNRAAAAAPYAALAVIGVAAGQAIGSALNEQLFKFGEKADAGYRKALSADNGRELTRAFLMAAEGEAGKSASSLGNILSGTIGILGDAITAGQFDLLDRLVKRISAGGFQKAFSKIATLDPAAAESILDYIEKNDSLRAKLADTGVSLEEYRRRIETVGDANLDGKVTFEEITASIEEQSKAADDLIEIMGSQGAAARSMQEATLGIADAQKSLTEAQNEYTDAVKSGDPVRIAEAQATLQRAMLALAAAQDSARDAAFRHAEQLLALEAVAGDKEAYDAAIEKLERMKAILTDPAEKNAIQERIDVLKAFRAEVDQVGSALTRFAERYGVRIQDLAPNVRREILGGRASGGPVAAGTPYLVGEQGPELFVPTGNGMIVPNNQLNSSAGTAAGGITVNVASSILSTPAETGAAVVDALTAWSRRNGRLPAPLVA